MPVLYFSLSVSLYSSVSEEGGSGPDSLVDLYHRVLVLPARGWTVLKLLPLPETGETNCCLMQGFPTNTVSDCYCQHYSCYYSCYWFLKATL